MWVPFAGAIFEKTLPCDHRGGAWACGPSSSRASGIQYPLLRGPPLATRTIELMTNENIEIIKEVYEAFAHQDLEGLLTLVDPECLITQDASLPWGGHHVGHDDATTFAFALIGSIDSAVTVESLFEADGQVIQCGRTKGTVRENGNAFDIPEVHIWTLKEGRVVAAHFAIDTPAMLAALR
jgi:ketosteroid isomerase-like protein